MDKALAASYLGKHTLIGIKLVDEEGNLLEQEQHHGQIIRINDTEGIVVQLHGTQEEMKLPPLLKSLQLAKPGEYRLRSTGEVVINPDYISNWTITKEESGAN